MSGTLTHSPADVLRYLLVSLGLGTLKSSASTWPISVSSELDKPDNTITIYDTGGRIQGRAQTDGEVQEHHGVQIRVRSITSIAGDTKARAIMTALDTSILRSPITVGRTDYIVYAVTRTTDVLPLGKESPTSKCYLFTINALVALRQST